MLVLMICYCLELGSAIAFIFPFQYIGVKIIPGGTVSGRSLVDSPVMHSDAISRHCGKLASVVIPKAEVETEAIQKRLNFHPTIVRDTTGIKLFEQFS